MFNFLKRKTKPKTKKSIENTKYSTPASAPYHQLPTATSQPPTDDFGLSMIMGMATHSPLIGMAVGGSLLGGIAGAELSESAISNNNDSSSSCDNSSSVCDSGSSYDGGSSFDSGSSYDSGSCGGGDF